MANGDAQTLRRYDAPSSSNKIQATIKKQIIIVDNFNKFNMFISNYFKLTIKINAASINGRLRMAPTLRRYDAP